MFKVYNIYQRSLVMDKSRSLLIASVGTALSASLCCTVPVIALIGGFGSTASFFSSFGNWKWVLICFSIGTLGLAWFFALRKTPDCECENPSIFRNRKFLITTTIISFFLIAGPLLYSAVNSHKNSNLSTDGNQNSILKNQIENCCKIKQK